MPTTEPNGETAVPPIRVLVVDDHPALRAGLRGLLDSEPGFFCCGVVTSETELFQSLAAAAPQVVVLDYALGRSDGLTACFRLKQRSDSPGVVLYSAYVDDVFAVPAALAQADGVVSKSASVGTLLEAISATAMGRAHRPLPDAEEIGAASARLADDDLPVLGMLLARVSVPEIADTLGVAAAEVRSRALRMIGEMQAPDRIAVQFGAR